MALACKNIKKPWGVGWLSDEPIYTGTKTTEGLIMYINLTRHGKMNWKLPEHGMKDPPHGYSIYKWALIKKAVTLFNQLQDMYMQSVILWPWVISVYYVHKAACLFKGTAMECCAASKAETQLRRTASPGSFGNISGSSSLNKKLSLKYTLKG